MYVSGINATQLINILTYLLNSMARRKHCDYHGECKNKAYREVYPSMLGKKYKNRGWSYLCKKHYYQEQKKFNGKLANCNL